MNNNRDIGQAPFDKRPFWRNPLFWSGVGITSAATALMYMVILIATSA